MAKNFLDLHNARSAKAKARVKARVQHALAKIPIQDLQQASRLMFFYKKNISLEDIYPKNN